MQLQRVASHADDAHARRGVVAAELATGHVSSLVPRVFCCDCTAHTSDANKNYQLHRRRSHQQLQNEHIVGACRKRRPAVEAGAVRCRSEWVCVTAGAGLLAHLLDG